MHFKRICLWLKLWLVFNPIRTSVNFPSSFSSFRPERQTNVVGRPKGQGQTTDTLLDRRKKEANKSRVSNHNRRTMADRKRNKGMIPSWPVWLQAAQPAGLMVGGRDGRKAAEVWGRGREEESSSGVVLVCCCDFCSCFHLLQLLFLLKKGKVTEGFQLLGKCHVSLQTSFALCIRSE